MEVEWGFAWCFVDWETKKNAVQTFLTMGWNRNTTDQESGKNIHCNLEKDIIYLKALKTYKCSLFSWQQIRMNHSQIRDMIWYKCLKVGYLPEGSMNFTSGWFRPIVVDSIMEIATKKRDWCHRGTNKSPKKRGYCSCTRMKTIGEQDGDPFRPMI